MARIAILKLERIPAIINKLFIREFVLFINLKSLVLYSAYDLKGEGRYYINNFRKSVNLRIYNKLI